VVAGALVLHEHATRLLGVDLLGDPEQLLGYVRPALEVMGQGVLTPEAYDRLAAAMRRRAGDLTSQRRQRHHHRRGPDRQRHPWTPPRRHDPPWQRSSEPRGWSRSTAAAPSRVRALDGLDLEIAPGEVFGFLGPNGAGKSTTIRVLLDQLRPTAGRAEVFGTSPRAAVPRQRARIGYLPGELQMTGRATAGELLRHLAHLRGGVGADRIGDLAERLSLDLDRPIRGLSKGNKQKVGVIQAFLHRPELLILDEPTSGLDPLLQHEFLAMVREAQADGATVFMSSHVLSEVEVIAERVAIVRAGRIVDLDDVATLRHHAGQRVELHFAEPVDAAAFATCPASATSRWPTTTSPACCAASQTPLLQGRGPPPRHPLVRAGPRARGPVPRPLPDARHRGGGGPPWPLTAP
jgi:ABC-2 type transport system ATP-binding protein